MSVMTIWIWFIFFLGIYAGSYIPKEARQKFENFIAAMFGPKPKKIEVKEVKQDGIKSP